LKYRAFLALPLLLSGCDAVLGLPDEPGHRPVDAGQDHEIADAGVTDAADAADAADTSWADTAPVDSGIDAADTSHPLDDATSCRVILARALAQGSHPPSGVYTILQAGKRLAFCDMVIDGGGWTGIYAGMNGSASGNFQDPEVGGSCPDPETTCVHRAPMTLDASTEFLVTCGGAAIAFAPGAAGLDFFQRGIEASWISLANVRAVVGGANAAFAGQLWTGETGNNGFIFSQREDPDPQAYSTHTFANGYNFSSSWNYCNGVADTKATVRILYR
jgi:hypothetical protein